MQYAFFLGFNNTLSAVEVLAALKAASIACTVVLTDPKVLIVDLAEELPPKFLNTLGGSDRIAKVLAVSKTLWSAPEIVTLLGKPSAKIWLGMSSLPEKNAEISRLAFAVKQEAKELGFKLKFILPIGGKAQLNTAQVFFNKLQEEPNAELTIVKNEDNYYLLRTIAVQNIPAYEVRDTARPARDRRIGMLPPKLAQMMLNISLGNRVKSDDKISVLDPFCGMGTVLQESWLRGFLATGSDSNRKMITAAKENLAHLASEKFPVDEKNTPSLLFHDVRQEFPSNFRNKFDVIVTEPYLGPAQHAPLPTRQLENIVKQLAELYLLAFQNMRPVLKNGGQILFLMPVFHYGRGPADFLPFPSQILDDIAKIGYSLKTLIPAELSASYQGTPRGTIVYSRPNAWVGRELTLWEKHRI